MFVKILILTLSLFALNEAKSKSLDFLSSLNLSPDEELSRFRRDVDEVKPVSAVSRLAEIIKKGSERNLNISVLAWQHVYDETGKIVEVGALELAFPAKNNSEVDDILDAEEVFYDRSNQHEVTVTLKELFEADDINFSVDVFIQVKKPKEEAKLIYWSPNAVYFKPDDGLVTFNKTVAATKEEVDSFVESIEEKKADLTLQPLVLKFDADENVILSESTLVLPSVVAYVVDVDEHIPDEIVVEGPKILAEVAIKHEENEIPQFLTEKFNEVFKEYEWRVLVSPGEVYITKDVWIQLGLDGFEFYQGEDQIYYVYGILKPTNRT